MCSFLRSDFVLFAKGVIAYVKKKSICDIDRFIAYHLRDVHYIPHH